MPILTTPAWVIDYIEAGQGPTVILLHSSVSGNRQWRALIAAMSGRYRLIAINLFGYGQTSPWPGDRPQTLANQSELVQPFIDQVRDSAAVIGHSFGGAVAMRAVLDNPGKVTRLVLLEPNPFRLLAHAGRGDAFAEIHRLRDFIKHHGAAGDWEVVAARFSDYWNGEGSWAAMAPERRAAFTASMRPNFHEWDAVLGDTTSIHEWTCTEAETLVVSARDTKRPMVEIVDLLRAAAPRWHFAELPEGGHMFPLTRPDLANPVIMGFLEARSTSDMG